MDYKESDVIGFDALYESMLNCKKGVLWKDSTAAFYLRGVERTAKLSEQLHDGTYQSSPPRHFTVTSPKPREIASISFRDRVYQRSLNDNIVYPVMSKSFIYDNFACQKGKGTDAARNRLKEFLHRYYRKHGHTGYVAQFDIKGYYPNMRHDVAESVFRENLQPWVYERVEAILHDQYKGDKGYNPGSQLVQIAGISVLNKLDHYIKEQLHVKYYIRYMDDLILIHHDKDFLNDCFEKISAYLANMGFELNEKKSCVYPLDKGIEFLGFVYRLTDTGKVLMLIKSSNVKAQRRKLIRLVRKALNGTPTRKKVDESYNAWRDHASKGNTFKLLQRMDRYYDGLWNGGLAQ